jgi:hypothetical protein
LTTALRWSVSQGWLTRNVDGTYNDYFTDGELELVPTFAIESGRHYRTRTGKVTGRVSKGDTGFEAVVDGKVRIYDAAGGAVHGGDDIVEEWAPKVGERVRFVRDNTDGGAEYGAKGEVVTVMSEASDVGSCQIDVSSSHLSWNPGAYLSDLEPLPVAAEAQPAATLKIEAGRYYRTRDGRKVGPMRDDWSMESVYHYHVTEGILTGNLWSATGGGYPGQEQDTDLIAEWQDTPSAPVAAQVDAIAEEYGPVVAASKPKFKVGDRVRSVENGRTRGLIGEVIDFDGSIVPYLIRFDGFTEGHGASDNEWWLQASEVDVPTSITAIVALIEDGQPKPATRPYVHTSEEAAATEAKRLAGIHKGKQFGVFVLTTTAEEAKPAYRHEWQRLAADGQKIAAIKELRAANDLTLKGAKDAVEHWLAVIAA